EKQCFQVPVVTARGLLEARAIQEARLVLGAAVISVDYYKRFLSGFRKIFGGELHSYSALIDRGRREALLRMRAEFPDADLYLNCRLETASVFKGYGQAMGSIEVVAYATAIKYRA
ncbi:MAG: heavy metal-binding domain-containing protein, partial [Planctomycetota bacterium]